MQEEVENRTLTLVVSGTKFTGRLFKAAITKYLAHRKEKKLQKQKSRDTPVIPHGKQTVKQLIGQNQGVSNIEITDPSIKEFEKIARKYGVDVTISAVPKGGRERQEYSMPSIDHEAEQHINAQEAEFGADGPEYFRRPKQPQPLRFENCMSNTSPLYLPLLWKMCHIAMPAVTVTMRTP